MAVKRSKKIAISIVSHKHGMKVKTVLDCIHHFCDAETLDVYVTVNVPERIFFSPDHYTYPLTVIENNKPKGYGTNNNQAFKLSNSRYFCIINPDIYFDKDPFPQLLSLFDNEDIGAVVPAVYSPDGRLEDNVRELPTPKGLLKKAFQDSTIRYPYSKKNGIQEIECSAGMFMLFRSIVFQSIKGFNERFFLYYEDFELCLRLRLNGYRVLWNPGVAVVHEGQRASHREFKHFVWHMSSIIRYFSIRKSLENRKFSLP